MSFKRSPRSLFCCSIHRLQKLVIPGIEESPTWEWGPGRGPHSRWPLIRCLLASLGSLNIIQQLMSVCQWFKYMIFWPTLVLPLSSISGVLSNVWHVGIEIALWGFYRRVQSYRGTIFSSRRCRKLVLPVIWKYFNFRLKFSTFLYHRKYSFPISRTAKNRRLPLKPLNKSFSWRSWGEPILYNTQNFTIT